MFIWGTKGSVQKIGYLMQECPSCASGPFAVHQAKKKFTLYFIPTFSYSNKQYLECLSCHDSFEVPSEMKPTIEQNLLTQAEFSALAKNELAGSESDNPRYLEEPRPNNTDKNVTASKYCTNCGENQPLITNFCSKCGTDLSNIGTT
jgi:hypothetical protein